MRLVLLIGCLSLSACAAFLTVRLRNLNRKFTGRSMEMDGLSAGDYHLQNPWIEGSLDRDFFSVAVLTQPATDDSVIVISENGRIDTARQCDALSPPHPLDCI